MDNFTFSVVDKDNVPVPMEELDKIAREIWGCGPDPAEYAVPNEKDSPWPEVIQAALDHPCSVIAVNWNGVKNGIWVAEMWGLGSKTKDEQQEGFNRAQDYIAPYFKLINHWEFLGYKIVIAK